ncbi:MAG: TraR/DksA C4-type zinc finger protein [Desulfovibrio sp.]|nr:TraR/DksA C4-type zinc finger protein [Desulfovibrio sp.]
MACTLTQEQIDKVIAFHGHQCPGLALGVRAAEWALANMGNALDEEIVTVTETDMCAVDAIQALVGCTFGKGNLIYRDQGKIAFTFYRRKDGKSARLVLRSDFVCGENDAHRRELPRRFRADEELTQEERALQASMRKEKCERIMSMPLEEIYLVKPAEGPMPHRARLMESLICEDCGEGVMESRIRRLQGKYYCISCFKKHDDR